MGKQIVRRPHGLRFLLFIILLTGCSSGGSTGPSSSFSFSQVREIGDNGVYLASNGSLTSGDNLALDVKLDNVIAGDVFGAAFDVDFDPAKIAYTGKVAGNFLEEGGNSVLYNVTDSGGKLLVGVTRVSPATGRQGSGTLITLKFTKVADGETGVDFSNANLRLDSSTNIAGIRWTGGTVTVF